MTIKIKIKKEKIDKEQILQRKKQILGNDFEKGKGLISKCYVFIYVNKALNSKELREKLNEHYNEDFANMDIWRATNKLLNIGLITKYVSGEILSMTETEKNDIHRFIEAKHRKFLQKIVPQFRNRFTNVNYFSVSNGDFEEVLKWACKLNGFEFSDE